ncbi:MAG: 4Fe-4S dicluster domain-containing protein [Dehalococcoidales bacterium]|nr:4Fe-4S dicluster domain-containing protein [Dehalococcoidales bacterium]
MSPDVEIFSGISGYVVFWILFAIAAGFFVRRAFLLIRLVKLGRHEKRFDRPLYRIFSMIRIAFSQSSNLKSFTLTDPAALGHAFMLWGLIIFGIGYVIFIGFGAGFGLYSSISGSGFETAFFSVLDIVALLVIITMIMVVVKRYFARPERLKREENTYEKITQAGLITVIFGLMVLHFLIEGFRYASFGIPDPGPPLGALLGQALAGSGISTGTSDAVFKSLWWVNYILLLIGVIYAPHSKHLHPLTSFANLAFRDLGPKGRLKTVDLKKKETYGASRIQDFTWKQLLDGYACTWCGRCHVVCPAQVSGKPLSPRELILGMKDHLMKEGPQLLKNPAAPAVLTGASITEADAAGAAEKKDSGKPLIDNMISEDAVWACTTCRACQEVCPVSNEHIDKIIDLRRHLQMVAMAETGRDTLKNMRVRGNPWRGTMYARTDWAEDLDVKIVGEDSDIDILFWVGCTEALEDRSLKVAQAMARLMKQAGVNFGILGEEEMCCGDPARRLGAEHLYQMLVTSNIQLFQSYNIKKIVTACPHCFNTFKNEYPRFGGEFEVVHHTQFIASLIKNNKLKIRLPGQGLVTYQEPCYLGRYNDIFEEPRQVISSIPGVTLVEMEQNRKNGFCCGGGGGRMWLEENIGQRISEIRLDQAVRTRAQILATACPFCLQMFEDAAKEKETESPMIIKDIAELVAESLEIQPDAPEK